MDTGGDCQTNVRSTVDSHNIDDQALLTPHPNNVLSSAAFMNKSAYSAINTGLPLNKMVILNRAIGDSDNTETSTSNSSAFSMDFYYTLVHLDRPWIDPQLIEN